jgi:hypothetical protein
VRDQQLEFNGLNEVWLNDGDDNVLCLIVIHIGKDAKGHSYGSKGQWNDIMNDEWWILDEIMTPSRHHFMDAMAIFLLYVYTILRPKSKSK